MNDSRIRVLWLCDRDSAVDAAVSAHLAQLGIDVERQVQARSTGPRMARLARWLNRLTSRSEAGHVRLPHLIHARSAASAERALALSERMGVPYLLSLTEFPQPGFRVRVSTRSCLGFLADDEDLADEFRLAMGIPSAAITRIPAAFLAPSVPPKSVTPARLKVVATVLAERPDRGLDDFLRAARRLSDSARTVEFVIAASATGDMEHRARAMSRALGLDERMTFVSTDSVPGLFWSAVSVFVQAAAGPCVGRSLGDALARGLPCVVSDVPGLRRLVADGTGRVVPCGDAVVLAETIGELLDDPQAAHRLGEAARLRVERVYRPELQADALAALYGSCTSHDFGAPSPHFSGRALRVRS